MYKLCFYVPASHLEAVKTAVFAAGAGRVGDYNCCCWQVLGEGQFRPLPGSDPFVGEAGEIKRVDEYRVELVCASDCVADAITALQAAHPYEQPAWDVIELTNGRFDKNDG
ncbi:MAG: NGG1p interacting factor NIF3 [Pseudomonadota bacterium]